MSPLFLWIISSGRQMLCRSLPRTFSFYQFIVIIKITQSQTVHSIQFVHNGMRRIRYMYSQWSIKLLKIKHLSSTWLSNNLEMAIMRAHLYGIRSSSRSTDWLSDDTSVWMWPVDGGTSLKSIQITKKKKRTTKTSLRKVTNRFEPTHVIY